ncbi:MAG: DUF3084 domain-containing protein [Cyanobacteria bacterium J06598_3]
MTGFVLIFAVACLGGVIATVGDRIGMKVGKSRLSLFNLRPRQTATLVSVATGMVASFSTLMLLIALDGQLRKGLFDLDDIQADLASAQTDLESTQREKTLVESDLADAINRQDEAQNRLQETNESLETAVAREEETLANLQETRAQLESVSEQAGGLRDEIGSLRAERQALVDEQAKVRSQIAQRDDEIAQRNQQLSERDQALALRNLELRDRDVQIAQRDSEITEREEQLDALEQQKAFIDQEIARLEQEFNSLRRGNVAIARNETLALTITRADSEEAARRAVEDALLRANQQAVQKVLPGTDTINDLAIFVAPSVVNDIVSRISDTRNYVIRVSSAANYILGEPCVNAAITRGDEPCLLINVDAAVNEVRFEQGEALAAINIDAGISNESLLERYAVLQTTAEFQARRSGIIRYSPIIANGRPETIFEFLAQVQAYDEPLEIRAIANQPILTTGPVYLDLVAIQESQIILRAPSPDPSLPEASPNAEPLSSQMDDRLGGRLSLRRSRPR